jgi:hypothetical protein
MGKGRRSFTAARSRFLVCLACLAAPLCAVTPAREASAFCGFYVGGTDALLLNNATIVVLLRDGTRTVLSMQNNYQGPPDKFAMVVPVPVVLQKENVKTLPREVFDHIDQLASPRLVEYWEQDPCAQLQRDGAFGSATAVASAAPSIAAQGGAGYGVKIEAQFTVGEYEIVILSAKDSSGLDRWLKDNHYKIPEGAEPLLRPYVRDGSKFFVAKVDVSKVKMEKGMAMLSPLRFHYDSEKFNLPVRLGLANSPGTQDLLVHILARGKRYEAANYKNVTIPTNLDVDEKAREQFSAFYAALFDRTLETNLDSDKRPPVVTEYSWDVSSCDPCPGPPLDDGDIATLGADTLGVPSSAASSSAAPSSAPAPGRPPMTSPCGCAPSDLMCNMKCAAGPQKSQPKGAQPASPPPAATGAPLSYQDYSGYVVTRLHARYTKDQLAEDLVFKEAEPISGGREVYAQAGPGQKLENGATKAYSNNFQGRYAIRHAWTGPVQCANPQRGIWGGPPSGQTGAGGETRAARDLAFAPRGGIDLATMVRQSVPEIGLVTKAPMPPVAQPASSSSSSASPAASHAPGAASPSSGSSSGCSVGPATGPESEPGRWALAACIAAALGGLARRRGARKRDSA